VDATFQDVRIVPRHELPSQKPVLVVVWRDGTLFGGGPHLRPTDCSHSQRQLGALGFLTEVRLADLYTTLEGWKGWLLPRWMHEPVAYRGHACRGPLYKEYEALTMW